MALGAVLVDRAYLIRQEAIVVGGEEGEGEEVEGTTVVEVEGSTVYEEDEGPEFKARLQIESASERTRDGVTQTDPRPMLLTAKKDSEGTELDFKPSDRIKVVSKQLGTAIWEVDGEPEPLRKKRTVIGWQLTLHRVEEQ